MPIKRFTLLAILFIAFAFIFQSNAIAQPIANATWTISPPNSSQGYANGETIDICVTVSEIFFADGSDVHGFQWELPEGLDPNTLSIIEQPTSCSDGTWNWYGAVTSGGSGITYGPGFFYDDGALSDLNPGNNYGDFCLFANYTMCLQIDVVQECNANTLTDLTPTLNIYGDGVTGAWSSNDTDPYSSQPDAEMFLQCCDAYPGESQGLIAICENAPICLIDLLAGDTEPDANGIWAGPTPYDALDDCGSFDPTFDPPGIYTYTVIGTGGCFLSASVEMGFNTIQIGEETNCQNTVFDLNSYLIAEGLPTTGSWYNPLMVEVQNGIVDPNTDISGEYQYQFYDSNNCFTIGTFGLAFSEPQNPGIETTLDLCANTTSICPFELLDGNPSTGGQWVVYDGDAGFLGYLEQFDDCWAVTDLEDAYKFTYIISAPPCSATYTDLYINIIDSPIQASDISATFCVEASAILLDSLLDLNPNQPLSSDVIWTDISTPSTGVPLTNPIDFSAYPENTSLSLSYSASFGQCDVSGTLTITILPAEADAGISSEIETCPYFSLSLIDALEGSPQSGGVWTNPSGYETEGIYVSGPFSEGLYTYTIATSCDTSTATLNITETPSMVSNTSHAVCESEGFFDLTIFIPPTTDMSGFWTGVNEPIALPFIQTEPANEGIYTYTTLINNGCQQVFNLDISIDSEVSAGLDQSISICSDGSPVDLFNYLPPNTSPLGNFSDNGFPGTDAYDGTYVYIIENGACPSDSANYEIDISSQPILVDFTKVCSDSDPTNYYVIALLASGTPPYNSANGTFDNTVFTSDVMSVSNDPQFDFYISDANQCNLNIIGTISDLNNDGVCDEVGIIGCQDPLAQNYNPLATIAGSCSYGFIGDMSISLNPGADLEGGRPADTNLSQFENQAFNRKNASEWDFTIYPNPLENNHSLGLSITGLEANAILKVHDLTGRILWTEIIKGENSKHFRALEAAPKFESGTYLISVTKSNGDVKTKSLLISN